APFPTVASGPSASGGSGESRSATCTSFVRPRSVPGAVISRKSAMRIRQFLDRDYRNKSALEPAGWLAGPDQQRCGNFRPMHYPLATWRTGLCLEASNMSTELAQGFLATPEKFEPGP